MVLASRASGCLFGHPNPLKEPLRTPTFLCGISKNVNLNLIIELFHLLLVPMALINDIIPYFDEFIQVHGWNMSILWSPLKIWTPQNFTTVNFRHPVSKSWLRHCCPFMPEKLLTRFIWTQDTSENNCWNHAWTQKILEKLWIGSWSTFFLQILSEKKCFGHIDDTKIIR